MTSNSDLRKQLEKLFEITSKFNASDLHLKVGSSPILRIKGSIKTLDTKPLTNEDIKGLMYSILTNEQRVEFEQKGDIDLAYSVEKIGRFRINIFKQRGNISVAVRRVNSYIPTFEELNLPSILKKIALYNQGLVLICGPTGSGKSTTLASMIQYINKNRRCHIITIEDPIEYIYEDEKSFINQREVGIDVESFHSALKYVVRQDPDVILIGEMRDSETFSAALTASETGHLVFGTLHSSTVAQTFGRIYDIFPSHERDSIRKSLMFNLKSIICQRLVPTKDGSGRVPINEIMIMNPTIQKLIEEKKEKMIGDLIRTYIEEGMCDFNTSIYNRIKEGLISEKEGLKYSTNPEQLKMNLKGIFITDKVILE